MTAYYAMLATYVFLIGLVIGSFLNVVIYRLPRGESLSRGRSHCPACGHDIRWYDNIPLLSFVLLRGKCRDCRSAISPRYFLVELLTALLFTAVFFKESAQVTDILDWPNLIMLVLYLYFVGVLIAVSFIDADHHIIPNKIVYPAFVIGAVTLAALQRDTAVLLSMLVGVIFGGGLLFLIYLLAPLVFKKQGMGFGDVKLGAVLGIYLGPPVILTLFLSSLIGTLYGLIMIFTKRLKWQQRFAFGPCLCAAALITYFFGTPIINWYLGLFLR
jgi:leader peptidase (prepilin peptidase) / N-methyltransferase